MCTLYWPTLTLLRSISRLIREIPSTGRDGGDHKHSVCSSGAVLVNGPKAMSKVHNRHRLNSGPLHDPQQQEKANINDEMTRRVFNGLLDPVQPKAEHAFTVTPVETGWDRYRFGCLSLLPISAHTMTSTTLSVDNAHSVPCLVSPFYVSSLSHHPQSPVHRPFLSVSVSPGSSPLTFHFLSP